MKTTYILLAAVLVVLLDRPAFSEALQASGSTALYTLEAIEDGDTLLLSVNGKPTRVQILGIDAPESVQNAKFKLDIKNTGLSEAALLELGEASSDHMRSLLAETEQVSIQGDLRAADRYGRIPAIVKNSKGKDLGESMVLEGYAVMLDSSPQDREYTQRLDRVERFARMGNNGLWGSHNERFRTWYERTR